MLPVFEFHQKKNQKSYIGWPQQPPTEKVPNISENLDFWWFIPQKGTSIGHFGTEDHQTIRIRKFFEEIMLLRLLRPVRLQRPPRSMRLHRLLRPGKSQLRSSKSSRFLNLIIWELCYQFILMFWRPASLCYFSKNWLMQLKCPNLRNTQISLCWLNT